MKTIVVTGGAGFIGANLCLRLVAEGNRVVCLDNMLTGDARNIRELKDESLFSFLRADICRPLSIDDPVDEVYDLACPASPPDYQKYAIETLKACAGGVENVLDFTRDKNAKFLHTSTSEIYGDPFEHPQKETYWGHVNPIGDRSCYDEGKRFAESLIVNYRKRHGLDAKIVRVFNTYGPRMRPNDGRVVSNFINQALSGEDLTVYGDGSHTRSFCFISDMVDGLMAMMASIEAGPVNLGNPIELQVRDLAEKIIKSTGSASRITNKPLPADDPAQRKPDITLAKEKLNWTPSVGLDEGLAATVEWFAGLKQESERE